MIKLRQATLTDLAQIVALDQEIFGAYGAEESPDVIRARLEVFPEGCAVLEDSTSDTADDPMSFLGYLTTEKWAEAREPALDEDPHLTHQPAGQVLCITTLAIAPTSQNRGLGPRLVEKAITIAQQEGCNRIILETARAKRFYLRHGFDLIGERCQRDIPLYIMQQRL